MKRFLVLLIAASLAALSFSYVALSPFLSGLCLPPVVA